MTKKMTNRAHPPIDYVCKCSDCGDAITAMPREPVRIPDSWTYCPSHGWFCPLCIRIKGLEVCEKKDLAVRYDLSKRSPQITLGSISGGGGWYVGRPNGQAPPNDYEIISPMYHKAEQAYGWAIENVAEVSDD